MNVSLSLSLGRFIGFHGRNCWHNCCARVALFGSLSSNWTFRLVLEEQSSLVGRKNRVVPVTWRNSIDYKYSKYSTFRPSSMTATSSRSSNVYRTHRHGRIGGGRNRNPFFPFPPLPIASIAVCVIVAGVRVVVRQCGILCDQMQWPGPYTLPVLLVSW